MSYLIEFIKDDKVNKSLVTKGTTMKVSKSIRDAKIGSGVAKDAKAPTSTKKDK